MMCGTAATTAKYIHISKKWFVRRKHGLAVAFYTGIMWLTAAADGRLIETAVVEPTENLRKKACGCLAPNPQPHPL